jgi:pantoate--beta-alanine ligase
MRIIADPRLLHKFVAKWKNSHSLTEKIALVPTMGCLHEGHLSLIRMAKKKAHLVIVSIFVNPLQFGPAEDFEKYPHPFNKDVKLCQKEKVDIIFAPTPEAMYPDGKPAVKLNEEKLSKYLCGASRPGHFQGVLTVVSKLFNICQPDLAIFGQKDAQQLRIIQEMVHDLNFPVKIIPAPIIREPDGLAMSSRNTYLSPEERKDALCLSNALRTARMLYKNGCNNATHMKKAMIKIITQVKNAKIDYVEICDAETFVPAKNLEGKKTIVALAVKIGTTRLIDNLLLPDDRLSNLKD